MRIPTFLLAFCGVWLLSWAGLHAQNYVHFSINQPAAPAAAFSFATQNTTYTMTNLSTGSGLIYSWTFGDGNTSTLPSPVHTYAVEGNYTICLAITDANNCTSTTCDSILVVGVAHALPGNTLTVAPNPFDGQTYVAYTLPTAADVAVVVYDLLGAKVQTIAQGSQDAGPHRYRIGAELAAGTYILVLEADGMQLSRRIVKAQ